MEKITKEPGTVVAPEKFRIVILKAGPYLVYGNPPLKQQFIMLNEDKEAWYFKAGQEYCTRDEPTALCRCGVSENKPYCDGAHVDADWNPRLTAPTAPILDNAETIEGPGLTLTDNEGYCAFARICDAKGRVWNLVEKSDDKEARDLTIWESNHCPAGRLSAWESDMKTRHEPRFEPSLGLIEDPAIRASSALWVRGGIPIEREDGFVYEVRNRVTLCRCGQSSDKPLCDGTHASFHYSDDLPDQPLPDGEEF